MRNIIILLFTLFPLAITAQKYDTAWSVGQILKDSQMVLYTKVKRPPVWGNSWCAAINYNHNSNPDLSANLGRAIGYSGNSVLSLNIYGYGLSYSYRPYIHFRGPLLGVYAEYSGLFLPFINLRAEYLRDLKQNANYIKPSIGLSVVFFELTYGYGFNLSQSENLMKHTLTVRAKLYSGMRKWPTKSGKQFIKFKE